MKKNIAVLTLNTSQKFSMFTTNLTSCLKKHNEVKSNNSESCLEAGLGLDSMTSCLESNYFISEK